VKKGGNKGRAIKKQNKKGGKDNKKAKTQKR
jgi:hypothetical protein